MSMNDEKIDSPLPSQESRITHQPGTQRHSIRNSKRLNGKRGVKNEQSPFSFPSCSQTVAYLQWWKMRKKRQMFERDKRIYRPQRFDTQVDVKLEAEDAKKYKRIIAMTDVDPQYFTELSGRPVKEKFSLEQYVKDVREILKTKLLIGQEKDDCIRINQQFKQEMYNLRKIESRGRRYASSFEKFLSKDHKESMDLLETAEREAKLTAEISTIKNQLSEQCGQSRLDVYFWEEKWRMVKMCQIFLYRISPMSWRIKHDWLHRPESTENVVSATNLFSKYKTTEEDVSLENLIEFFEKDIAEAGPAELYFEDPFDLIRIFRTMETQNLNALIHLESLAGPMVDMAATIATTEARIKQEIGEITSMIDDLESCIIEEEERAINLEECANYLLRNAFRRLVCSEQVLYFYVFVEETYESCVGPNDTGLDSFTMMKWIDKIHEQLNLQLDNLPRRVVRACERKEFKQEIKATKEAEDAAKKFELMHRLLDALKRIMKPSVRKKRPLIRRSAPTQLIAKTELLIPQPTKEEAEYLTFFTNYCKRDDFQMYRLKFPDDFDLNFHSKQTDIQTEAVSSDLDVSLDVPLNTK